MPQLLPYSPDSLLVAAAALFAAVNLAEVLLRARWSRAYFRSGLALVVLRIPVVSHHRNLPPAARLEKFFGSAWIGSLVFREISPNTYAVRTRFFEVPLARVGALMHGIVFFDIENNQVVMKGFANWDMVCFSLLWPLVFTLPPEYAIYKLAALAFFTLVITTVYMFDIPRYSKVAWFAAAAWARLYEPKAEAEEDEAGSS